MNTSSAAESYYTPLAEGRYRPTRHAQGAWNDHEQHLAPVCGLLVHSLERHDPRPDLQLAKVTFDALGLIPLADSDIAVRTLRPGRTIEQVEATLSVDGRAVVRATAWRLARHDTSSVAGGFDAPADRLPPPDDVPAWQGARMWAGGYIASLDLRGTDSAEPGRRHAWIRPRPRLVEGKQVGTLAAFFGVVDTANGIGARVRPDAWLYPNVDLTVHLFREPEPGWVGFDTRAVYGPTGLGITSSTLHDVHGPVGRAEQCLTVRPVPQR